MARLLLIETATHVCSVALSVNNEIKAVKTSHVQNSHASLVTLFSEKVVTEAGYTFDNIDAFVVSKGPGSYTGLRIGVSTAKGFAYATGKKLISVNTLHSMAYGMKHQTEDHHRQKMLFCPMIDARRMEVYAAVFDNHLEEVKPTEAIIVDEHSFDDLLANNQVLFAGDGAAKCQPLLSENKNALFLKNFFPSATYMAQIAEKKYKKGEFEDVAYFEPFYLKDFVAGIPKVKGLR